MFTHEDLLNLFNRNTGSYLSGQRIGDELHLSRNSVRKAIHRLRCDGYDIEGKAGAGYLFRGKDDLLTFASITKHLHFSCDLQVFDEVGSTNDIASKAEVGLKPLLIVADKQTAGRGRRGRAFASPGGAGLYMTLALRPTFDVDKFLHVTMAAAVAVCRAIARVSGIDGQIKWVNDIFYQGKKVCGILTEGQSNSDTGKIDTLIIGIGVNCFPGPLPEELRDVAGYLSAVPGTFSRGQLAAEIANEILSILKAPDSMDFLREYRSKCFILGKRIFLHPRLDNRSILARAIDIDRYGGLIVEYMEGPKMGQVETLTTGEVSIRLNE